MNPATFEDKRAWFEHVRGFKLRPQVTEISVHELDAAADLSPRLDDGLGGRGRCTVCWLSGRHDIDLHVARWKAET